MRKVQEEKRFSATSRHHTSRYATSLHNTARHHTTRHFTSQHATARHNRVCYLRKTPEWIGKSDDTPVPPRVKDRIFKLFDGACAVCTRAISAKLRAAIDHILALCLGGQNRESNLQLLCVPCHTEKTRGDVALKKINNRVKAKHLGLTTPRQKIKSRPFAKAEPQRSASRPLKRHQDSQP